MSDQDFDQVYNTLPNITTRSNNLMSRYFIPDEKLKKLVHYLQNAPLHKVRFFTEEQIEFSMGFVHMRY